MKRIVIFLGLIIVMVLPACGGPKVKLNLTPHGEIEFKKAGGNTDPKEGLNILEKQSITQTRILLQKKLQTAIENDNFEKAEKIRNFIQTLEDNAEKNSLPNICIKNTSSYPVSILNGPFAGTIIPSGGKTSPKPFTLGIYEMKYITYGKNKKWTKNINLFISPSSTEITIINN